MKTITHTDRQSGSSPHWISLDFSWPAAEAETAMIQKFATAYDPDCGDSISEWAETRGLKPHQTRLLKAAIRRIERSRKCQ